MNSPATLEIRALTRSFGEKLALAATDLSVGGGCVHALLGPNGAGKTTLLRILTGLLAPDSGSVRVAGIDAVAQPLAARKRIGFVPSGDRTFYLRISGLENLVFFARLHGLSRRAATERALRAIDDVGLRDAAKQRVGLYSHGMEKRLSIARALLLDPPLLLVDEATHDLDPEGVRRVKELVGAAVARGTAVLWATQRLDEIRGFANRVLLLDKGVSRFQGPVEELVLRSVARRYLLRARNGHGVLGDATIAGIQASLVGRATVNRVGADPDSFRLDLLGDTVLSDALGALMSLGVQVLDCTQERSEIEEAFLQLTEAGR